MLSSAKPIMVANAIGELAKPYLYVEFTDWPIDRIAMEKAKRRLGTQARITKMALNVGDFKFKVLRSNKVRAIFVIFV